MKSIRMSGYVALGVLVLAGTGPGSHPTYAAGHQHSDDERESSGLKSAEKSIGKGVVLVELSEATPRAAANAPAPKPHSHSSSFSWTGIYVGAHFGYGKGNADTSVAPLPTAAIFINLLPQTLHPDPSGVLGGGQIGANWQSGRFVIGAEFDISGSGMDGTKTVTPIIQNNNTPFPGAGFITAHQDTTWLATLRPRVGVAIVPRLLVYGTGGLAFGHVNSSATTDFRPVGTETYPASFSKTKKGWIAGVGAEIGLTQRWSVKGEFQHYDLGSESITANPVPPLPPFQIAYRWESTANLVKFGINFKF